MMEATNGAGTCFPSCAHTFTACY